MYCITNPIKFPFHHRKLIKTSNRYHHFFPKFSSFDEHYLRIKGSHSQLQKKKLWFHLVSISFRDKFTSHRPPDCLLLILWCCETRFGLFLCLLFIQRTRFGKLWRPFRDSIFFSKEGYTLRFCWEKSWIDFGILSKLDFQLLPGFAPDGYA